MGEKKKKNQRLLDFKNIVGEMKDSIQGLENKVEEISPKVEENKRQERKDKKDDPVQKIVIFLSPE